MTAIKPVHILILLLLFASVLLGYDAVASAINPYLTVSDALQDSAGLHREVQVLATVADYSFDPDGSLRLTLTDGTARLNVTYRGVPPQGLLVGQKIVAIGTLVSPSELHANRLLLKCPSKYG